METRTKTCSPYPGGLILTRTHMENLELPSVFGGKTTFLLEIPGLWDRLCALIYVRWWERTMEIPRVRSGTQEQRGANSTPSCPRECRRQVVAGQCDGGRSDGPTSQWHTSIPELTHARDVLTQDLSGILPAAQIHPSHVGYNLWAARKAKEMPGQDAARKLPPSISAARPVPTSFQTRAKASPSGSSWTRPPSRPGPLHWTSPVPPKPGDGWSVLSCACACAGLRPASASRGEGFRSRALHHPLRASFDVWQVQGNVQTL